MASFKICVFKTQKRLDDKYPVWIRVYWKGAKSYIRTEYNVTINQISQKKGAFEVKDVFIINNLNERIELFEKKKTEIDIHNFNSKQLANYYSNLFSETESANIDFLRFGYNFCEQRKVQGKSYNRIKTTLNNLSDFCKNKLPINELTSKKLTAFENYLKTERKITRISQFKKEVTTTRKACSTHCIADYMSDIRTVFNAALYEYNDDDSGNILIKHYPFKKYKIPSVPETAKRNLTPQQIKRIAYFNSRSKRANIACDVFLLSFLLVGMNAADIYHLKPENYANGRITYNRQKTRGKRKDAALISIKVEPETELIIDYYRDPTNEKLLLFHKKYSTQQDFVQNVNKGLKTVAAACEIDVSLSSYYARHSWATIASNECNIDTATIALCLNHSIREFAITNIYIKKDWSKIDNANRKVLDAVFAVPNLCQNNVQNVPKSKSE